MHDATHDACACFILFHPLLYSCRLWHVATIVTICWAHKYFLCRLIIFSKRNVSCRLLHCFSFASQCVCVSFAFFGSNSRSLLYFTMSIENYGMSIPKHSHHSIDFSTLIVFSPRFYPFSISPFASGGSRPALSMRERRKRSSALNSSCATCPRNSKEPTRNKWRNQASADANGGSSSVESVDFAVWVASNDASEATTELGLLRVCSVFHPGTWDCYLYRSVQDWARTLTRTVAFLSYKHCPFLSCNSRHGAVASLTASRASSLDFWRGEDLSVRASKQRESEMFARVNACNTAYVSDTSWK